MKSEYDFSKGERGKFCHADAVLDMPVYLDPEIAAFVQRAAASKGVDVETLVNDWIGKDICHPLFATFRISYKIKLMPGFDKRLT